MKMNKTAAAITAGIITFGAMASSKNFISFIIKPSLPFGI